jgi:HAD superfamily hydrolase (TIGR01459 family)
MSSIATPPHIRHFSEIAAQYDLIICDVWGVLHNGLEAFPPAYQALQAAREAGKTVILLSNAPRPHQHIMAQLDKMQVPRNAYDAVVTSGDITQELMRERAGQPVYHLGPKRDLAVFAGLDAPLAALEQADYVLCTGLVHDMTETPQEYLPLLVTMKARNLEMLCANPDLVVERGDLLCYCAGALAELYTEMGGTALLLGKPFEIAYRFACAAALRVAGAVPEKNRIVSIGDAIRTDVRGAKQFDIATLFIGNGIHAADVMQQDRLDPARLERFLSEQQHRPDYVSEALNW